MLVEFSKLRDDPFLVEGVLHIASFLEPEDCDRAAREAIGFYAGARAKGLFFDEAEAEARGLLAPDAPGRRVERRNNLLYSSMSWFLESRSFEKLVRTMGAYTGPDIDMFLARLLITVPLRDIPDYIQRRYFPMEERLHGSINRFVKDEFLRAFFFIHNPWHQDWVDMPQSDLRFLTALLPVTDRGGERAPLYILPKSAAVEPQAMPVPHTEDGARTTLLTGPDGPRSFERRRIPARPGDLVAWPARTFHKVEPNRSAEPAINLRFNFAPSGARTGVRDPGSIQRVGRSALSRLCEAGPTAPDAPPFETYEEDKLIVAREGYS
jgi:hypothetical protein